MGAMLSALRRAAAAVALTAVLMCSGLGICWRQLGTGGHDCCATGETQLAMPAKPCAAPAETVAAVHVSGSPLHAEAAAAVPPAPAGERAPRYAPGFPAKAPPLVLRI